MIKSLYISLALALASGLFTTAATANSSASAGAFSSGSGSASAFSSSSSSGGLLVETFAFGGASAFAAAELDGEMIFSFAPSEDLIVVEVLGPELYVYLIDVEFEPLEFIEEEFEHIDFIFFF